MSSYESMVYRMRLPSVCNIETVWLSVTFQQAYTSLWRWAVFKTCLFTLGKNAFNRDSGRSFIKIICSNVEHKMIVVTFTVCGRRPHALAALQTDKLPLPLGANSSENHKDHRLQPRCAFTLTTLKFMLTDAVLIVPPSLIFQNISIDFLGSGSHFSLYVLCRNK